MVEGFGLIALWDFRVQGVACLCNCLKIMFRVRVATGDNVQASILNRDCQSNSVPEKQKWTCCSTMQFVQRLSAC